MPDAGPEFCSYEEFGRLFFARAVTRERVLRGIEAATRAPIDVGPMTVGPGGLAKVTARGAVGAPTASELPGDAVAYRVELPVALDLEVNLQVDTHTYHAELMVPLVITARATPALEIAVDVTPPSPDEITVDVEADGFRASVLQRVAGIDGEITKAVARQVARQVTSADGAPARLVDVGATIDRA